MREPVAVIRRLLPAVMALALLLTSTAATSAGGSAWQEDFEADLAAWTVQLSGAGSAAIAPAAALAGATGLALRAGGSRATVARRLPSGPGIVRIAFDVRRDGARRAEILTLLKNGRAFLSLQVTADGKVSLTDRTGVRHARLGTLLPGRIQRIVLRVDPATGRTQVRIGGATARVRTPGPRPVLLRLGGTGPTRLSVDSVAAEVVAPSPSPKPSPSVVPSPSVAPSVAPSPSVDPSPGTKVYRFKGKGSDHGVGMSQTGAYGRAKAGQGYAEILAHYYPGTIVETRSALLTRTIRVLVVEPVAAPAGSPLVACGRRGSWTIDGSELTFPAGACARFVAGSPGSVTVQDGETELWRADGSEWTVLPVAARTLLDLPARSPRNLLRGTLRVLVGATKGQVVNIVGVEDYLRSVVPLEMSPSRPTEALRAQAVAARSYALYHVRPTNPDFDVHDDARSQVYGGFTVEYAATDAAVADTAGQVATYAGRIINAVFHAQGGGATEDSRNVFNPADGSLGTDVPYLRGSLDVDPDGVPYDQGGSYDSWKTGTFTMPELSAIMARDARTDVGTIDRLVMTNRGVSGRLISVTLIGTDGSRKRVAGWLFKSVFNANRPTGGPLLSTLFERVVVP